MNARRNSDVRLVKFHGCARVISIVRCFRVKSTVDELRQNMNGVLAENPDYVDETKFLALALAEFPSLADEFAENEGLFHVQMGIFSRIARAAIERGDFTTLKRCYNLSRSKL